jgi:ubiquitin carboxyl-terminal hydrolase 5/13
MLLQLQIPLDSNRETKRPKTDESAREISFEDCLDKTFSTEVIQGFLSPATSKIGEAVKAVRFKTFPQYLLLQVQRYYVGEDWTPKKMNVLVSIPETLSLEKYRSAGWNHSTEMLLPEGTSVAAVVADASLVAQLVSMGFSQHGCERAAIATDNAGTEVAMEWIFGHMEDPDFNDPILPLMVESISVESVSNLCAMGFTKDQSERALKETCGDPDRAAEWLFSHMDDLDSASPIRADGGKGDYSLVGFVSHIGRDTGCGHYVAHIKKEGQWILYNDEKVAISKNPPLALGYMYLFRRNS